MKSYLAAAIQMTSVSNLQKNLAQAEEFIDLAVHQGAELIGLPENFSFMGEENEKLAQAGAIAQETEKFLKTMAQRFQVTILGGGFPVPVDDTNTLVYNTALLIDPSGQELARYQRYTCLMLTSQMVTLIENPRQSWLVSNYRLFTSHKNSVI